MGFLRMAKSQGLLTGGADMSPIQVMALSIVEREEQRERAREQVDHEVLTIKAALLNRNPAKADRLFPRYFLPAPEDAEADLDERIEQDEVTPEIAQDIDAWVAQAAQGGKITGAELDDDPDGGWQ